MTKRINCKTVISLALCMVMIAGILFPCNVHAASKVVGLVSESEYLSKYTNKEDYKAVPYYRYATRTKETKTSGYSSLEGWTLLRKELVSDVTSDWVCEYDLELPGALDELGTIISDKYETIRDLDVINVKEYYIYTDDNNLYYSTEETGVCKNKLMVFSPCVKEIPIFKKTTITGSFSKSNPGKFEKIYDIKYNGKSIQEWNPKSGFTDVTTEPWVVQFYKFMTKQYQYVYSRISDWSNWSDWTPEVKATGDTCKKDSTVMYYVTDIRKAEQTISGKSSYSVKYGAGSFNLNCSTNGDSILKYSSSNSNVVSVDSNGYVTVKGVGTATITVTASESDNYQPAQKMIQVTVGERNQTMDVEGNVKLGAPQLESKSDYKKIKFTWNEVPEASGYKVYVYDNDKKKYICKLTKNSSQRSAVIIGPILGKQYKVKVRAYKIVDGSEIYGEYSNVVSIILEDLVLLLGDAPFNLRVASDSGTIRYESTNTNVATVSSSGVVKAKKLGKTKIYITDLSDSKYKSASKTVWVTVQLKTTQLQYKNNYGKIKFTWDKVPGANGYKVYSYDKNKKKYICKMTRKSSQRYAVIREPKIGKEYKVKVRAYKNVNGKKVYSPYSDVVKVTGK